MPIETFRTNFPNVPHNMSGATLNRQNSILNAVASGVPIGMNGINTTGMASSAQLIPALGPMIITDIDDTCAENSDEPDNKGFPCRSSKKYLGKFRHYKSGAASGEWLETDEDERQIDMSVWWPDGVTSGPILLVDDIVTVMHDKMRGCYIPLDFPRVRPVMLSEDLGPGLGAEAFVLKRISAAPWWQKVTGVTLNVVDLSLNSGDPDYLAGTKGDAIWMTNVWQFLPLSCEPDDTGIQ